MEITDDKLNYIREQVARIQRGRVIIEINQTSGRLDIITESREQMPEEKKIDIKNSFRHG
jgi:hypothetical protein